MASNSFIIIKEADTYKCQPSINRALTALSTAGEAGAGKLVEIEA